MRLWLAALLSGFGSFANADPSTMIFEMPCDRALEMIIDSRSDRPVWLTEWEVAYVEGFLVGLGMVSAVSAPQAAEDSIAKGLGGLLAFCEGAPSRTISELSANFRP